MRRLTSLLLSLALTGLEPCAAFAQVRAQAVPVSVAPRVVAAPLAAPGLAPLTGPTLGSVALPLVKSALPSLQPALPSAPAAVSPARAAQARPAAAVTPARAAAAVSAPAAAPVLETLKAVPQGSAPAPEAAAAPASGEAQSALSGVLFDGSAARRSETGSGVEVAGRAGLSRPRLAPNAAAEESSEPAAETAPAPAAAPLLEGRLDLASYKLPLELRLRRGLALGAHYGLLAAVPALLTVAFGVLPAALGAAALGARVFVEKARAAKANGAAELTERELRATRELLLRHKRGEALSPAEMASLEERAAPFEQLLTWAEGTVDYLTGRLGLDPQSAPRVWIDESSHDLHWAASVGGRLDKSGAIYMGIGFVLRPLERAVGVLAHEMGHLFFGDKGVLRERLRMHGGWSGGLKTGLQDAGLATGAAAALQLALTAFGFVDPSFLLWGLGWAVAALASAAGALLAGLAATRQEELRADHFASWLADGSWLAAFLEDEAGRGREKRTRFARWADHILSTHPAWETRVERLARYVRPEALREAVLPVSDSLWGLSGETQAVVSGADASLAEALAAKAQGGYDFRLYQGMDGTLVVRAHPVFGARLDAAADRAAGALLAAVLAERFPGAKVLKGRSLAHPAVLRLKESALGRELLADFAEAPIALRWEAGGAGAARSVFSTVGPKPEIVLNHSFYWKAAPQAQAAALAGELARYRAWRKTGQAASDDEARAAAARVFAELGGAPSDEVK